MPKPRIPRHCVTAYVWPAGGIDRVKVVHSRNLTIHHLAGEDAPAWLRERAALLVNHAEDNSVRVGALGRRLEDGQFFIYLNGVEYRELMKCVHQAKIRRIAGALADGLNTAVREGNHDEKKQRTAALARAARFKPRIDDPQFQSWIRRLLRGLS